MVNAICCCPTSDCRRLQSFLVQTIFLSNCILVRLYVDECQWSCYFKFVPPISAVAKLRNNSCYHRSSTILSNNHMEIRLIFPWPDDDDDPQPSLISGACLPVYGSCAAQPHHRRLYYIHTPCQGWSHCNLFVWPCCSSARNQTWGINRRREATAEQISLRCLPFKLDGADAGVARGRRWATPAVRPQRPAVYLKRPGRSNEKQTGSSTADVITRQLQPGHRWMWRRRRSAEEASYSQGGPASPLILGLASLCCLCHSELPSHSKYVSTGQAEKHQMKV